MPINITLKINLINKILAYSDKKIKTNPPLIYSTLNPETNSDSPSEKSNGVRFISAINLNNIIKNNGIDINKNHTFFCIKLKLLKLNLSTIIINIKIINDKLTS